MTKSKPNRPVRANKRIMPRRTRINLADLPPAGSNHVGAYVYVIEFTSGVVKVGQTAVPRRRISQHQSDGAMHGYDVARVWVSPLHGDCDAREADLVEYGNRHGASVQSRKEYFTGLDFDAVVEFAAALEYAPCKELDEEESASMARAFVMGAHAQMASYLSESADPEDLYYARDFHIGAMFYRNFFFKHHLPAEIEGGTPAEMIERMRWLAEAKGVAPLELLDLNWIDVIEESVIEMVKVEAERLRDYAAAKKMWHLVEPQWSHIWWPAGYEDMSSDELFGPGMGPRVEGESEPPAAE